MKVTVDSKKGLKTNLKIFVDRKTIEEKIDSRLLELKKTINLKGFRPGKVPIQVLKKQFGKAIYGEVLENIMKDTSSKAIEEKKIKVIGQPKIDVTSYGEGKDLSYKLEVEQLPPIKIKPLKDMALTSYDITISKDDIEKRIEEISKNQNNFIDKKDTEMSSQGDLVVFDYEATVDNKVLEEGKGKNTQIVLGKDLFIPGFDKQLFNVKKNQTKDVHITLPQNYPNKNFANKKSIFKCKIVNIKKAVPIKIDNDFAKSLGAKDLDDLKTLISKQIHNQYNYSLDLILKEKILNHLDKENHFELPDNLVEQELALMTKGMKKEDFEKNKKENEKMAKRRIKLGLLLNEYGEKNNIKVEEQEIKNEIEKQIRSTPGQSKQLLEYYQKNPSAAESLRGNLYEEKIIDLIKQQAKKIKKTVSTKEAEKIIQEGYQVNKTAVEKTTKHKSSQTTKTPKTAQKRKKIRKK